MRKIAHRFGGVDHVEIQTVHGSAREADGEQRLKLLVARGLAEIVKERTQRNPEFPALVAEAETRRKLARRLARLREKKSLSQTVVAARMGTAASVVSKLEAGGDVKLSTLQRYFAAIGEKFAVAV